MALKLEHVNYIYSPDSAYEKQALKDVNLEIKDGEFIGLIGHTGSGKSTLIQHMNGILKASSGVIYYNGKNIYDTSFRLRDLRAKVGLVFQYPEHQLFEVTVMKDVCFGPANLGLDKATCEARAKEAMEMVGLTEQFWEKSPFDLSGGQKRRAAIAGVLAMKPDCIILDEPTAGLDPKGRTEILDQIRKLHEESGMTIILVSHSMEDVANYVDRILVMDKGQVLYDDEPAKVFANWEALEQIGLAAPKVSYIMRDLKAHGFEVSDAVTTVKEAKEEILKVLHGGKHD